VQAFDRPGAQAFLSELVPHEAIPSAVGLASSVQSIGRLGGPALAAVLYAWSGAASVFAVKAVSYAAVVGLVSDQVSPRAAIGLGASSAILAGLVLLVGGARRARNERMS
jgi:hypothetical protein